MTSAKLGNEDWNGKTGPYTAIHGQESSRQIHSFSTVLDVNVVVVTSNMAL